MAYLCKGVVISKDGRERINQLIKQNSSLALHKAVATNKKAFNQKILGYRQQNTGINELMQQRQTQLVALAMLYLGEGAKWQGSRAPRLGSSDPEIIQLYIHLLRACYGIELGSLRARVQCRADQDLCALTQYWSKVTGIQAEKFYLGYIDKRTIGKKTVKAGYRGVCTISCAGTHIQLELAEISSIIGEAMRGIGAVG